MKYYKQLSLRKLINALRVGVNQKRKFTICIPKEKDHHMEPAINIEDFEGLLQKATDLRGHRCLGLPLGIKMAQMGLKLLNMTEEEKREYLVVFVENDKCPADGIQVATGCSAGSRKLKMLYYGKSAASFVDARTGKGYRVVYKRKSKRSRLRPCC